ncbi:MAG: hypothetical protein ACW98X_24695 [Promethearchaeota archaeon]
MDTYNIYGLTQEKKAQRVELGRWCKYEDVKQALTEVRSQVIRDVVGIVEEQADCKNCICYSERKCIGCKTYKLIHAIKK